MFQSCKRLTIRKDDEKYHLQYPKSSKYQLQHPKCSKYQLQYPKSSKHQLLSLLSSSSCSSK